MFLGIPQNCELLLVGIILFFVMQKQIVSDVGNVKIHGVPDKCPFCHRSITPNILQSHVRGEALEVMFICPNAACNKCFIGYYHFNQALREYVFDGNTSIGTQTGKNFNEQIGLISPSFVLIYNQAFAAEQLNLKEICGVGYRKALEFLIKDYAILNNPSQKETIEKKLLGPCITDFVTDERIKAVAKRAVWLGNDETHYIRKWEGKNLGDLKKLIDLTVHWIEMEALSKSFEEEMPG